MTLVMNQLLDAKLTEIEEEKGKDHEPTETQEEDALVLRDYVSMFNMEDEDLPNKEETPETNVTTRSQNPLKEYNSILPKIKKLQENMKKIKNNNSTIKIPEFVISSQDPKKVNTPVQPTKIKTDNVKKNLKEHDMGYDVVEDIKKAKENISLFEMCNLPQQKEKLLKSLETPEEEPPSDNQPEEEIGEASLGGKYKYKTLAFLLTIGISTIMSITI